MSKESIQHEQTVLLKLTAGERRFLLENLEDLDPSFEKIVRSTPSGKALRVPRECLNDVVECIAAKVRLCQVAIVMLDAIGQKINQVQGQVTDKETSAKGRKQNARTLASSSTTKTIKSSSAGDQVYQFKITLLGIKPLIWRRIQVESCTLDKLHEHIQAAMGWTNSHLYQFHIQGRCYGRPEMLDFGFDGAHCINSQKTNLSDILPKSGKAFAFTYEYDFGDGWEHKVEFEGNAPKEKGTRYPICLEGWRACPPEDCGGVWGYAEFLEAIGNPKHESHQDMLEWIGGRFDPDEFDAIKATRAMRRGVPNVWMT